MTGWKNGSFWGRGSLITVSAVMVLGLSIASFSSRRILADVQQDRRTESGLKWFRRLLAADLEIEKKTIAERKVLVLFFFTEDGKRAAELGTAFEGRDPSREAIRGLSVTVETTSDPSFTGFVNRLPAGIFLTQAPDKKALQSIIQFGIANRIIVYSPFEGHVESGVLGGLAVEAQVRPYLNEATIAASHITLKDIFRKVAKVYR